MANKSPYEVQAKRIKVAEALPSSQGPKVLLTNDDGPESLFFQRWIKLLQSKQLLGIEHEDHVVILPSGERSYVGKMITRGNVLSTRICNSARSSTDVHSNESSLRNFDARSKEDREPKLDVTTDIKIKEEKESDENFLTYHLDCSPASCTNIGIHYLVPNSNVIISGPNVGHNVGMASILSSGTVGAAFEGQLSKKYSFALSFACLKGFKQTTESELDWSIIVASQIIKYYINRSFKDKQSSQNMPLYNINVPLSGLQKDQIDHNLKEEDLKGYFKETFIETKSSNYGSLYKQDDQGNFFFKPSMPRVWDNPNLTMGSDVHTIKNNMISVTKIYLDQLLHHR